MKPKEFIQFRLDELQSRPKDVPSFAAKEELIEFILKSILSKKFRKFSVQPHEFLVRIQETVKNSVEQNLPIKFVFPFGGYKLWRLEETPEADWAELFALMYYAKWLKPIADVYKPGVIFDFSSDDIIIEKLNNIPKTDTDAYAKSFVAVLEFIKKYLPENLKFTFTPVSSHYTPQEFEEDLQDKISTLQKELNGGLPVLDDESKRMVELNVRLRPQQDEDPLWKEKVELVHQAYYAVARRRAYNKAKDKIQTFCLQSENYLAVGTTKTSVAKFWPGIGALKKDGNGFMEYVLSPSQLEKTKLIKEDISIEGLNGKNFSKIKIFE